MGPIRTPDLSIHPPQVQPNISEADEKSILRREIELELADHPLEPWESDFAKWLALNPKISREKQLDAVEALAGTALSEPQLLALKARKAFRTLYKRHRGEFEAELDAAKDRFASLIPRAAEIYEKLLNRVEADEDVRGGPALLTPLLDRAWPKASPDQAPRAPSVHIHLSANQIAGLAAPIMVVEAEEVQKVIPAKTSGPA